jgi:hypothetical protein
MKRFLKRAAILIAALIVALLIVVAFQPNDFRVSRSATIAAPPEVAFAQVNDFHRWEAWSPWAKLDPSAKNAFEGPPAGQGAVMTWDGNKEVGQGKMTILESRPGERVRIKLDFIKPFENTCTSEFAFKPVAGAGGGQTQVTWSMYGHHSFLEKGFCMFKNMDKMVGGDFEKGLAAMRTAAERAAAAKPTTTKAE